MKLRNSLICIIVFLFFLWIGSSFSPIFLKKDRSYYNPTFDIIWCNNDKECFHEIGHSIDRNSNWPSRSDDYRITYGMYVTKMWLYPDERDELTYKIVFFPGFVNIAEKENNPFTLWFWRGGWGGPTELYAEMFAWTEGKREKMPEIFRDFYDWDLSEKLIATYIGE